MVLSSEEMRRKSVVKRNFQTLRRKDAEFSFYEHEMHERNGSFSHKLLSPFRKTNKNHRKQSKTFLLMIFSPIFREITSCFRHLEKPIKTKEHKIKHLFLYVFIGFVQFFQKAKAIFFKRRDAKPLSFLFANTKCARFVADPLTTGK